MKKIITAVLAVFVVAATSAYLPADTVIYTNDFDSEALGTAPDPFDDTGGPGADIDVVVGDATTFATQHLQISSRDDNFSYGFANFDGSTVGLAAEPVITFSFDAFFSSDCFTGIDAQLRMRARDTAFAGGTTDVSRFDINEGTPTADVINRYDYVVNNSTAAANAPVIGGSIASGTFAVYENGVQIGGGTNFTAADDLDVDKLTLWVRGDSTDGEEKQSIVLMDNFAVTVNSIPEPGSLVFIGLLGLAPMLRRRR